MMATPLSGAARWTGLCVGFLLVGCATAGPHRVGPEDIPDLQARVEAQPQDGDAFFRLAAALAEADRCPEAVEVARQGRDLLPADPKGPLLIGQCLEDQGEFSEALSLYARYLEEHGDAPGAQAVEGRRMTALRLQARQAAREAVANEESLEPADPETVGVLPFLVDGDPAYQALSVGLAHMLTTDLALLRRFPMVERVKLQALLDEMELPQEMIDPATAARAGRLVQASRVILGTVSIPSDQEARLGGNIVLQSGEMVEPLSTQGQMEDIISMEKDLALEIASQLGYQLSEAERQRILENRPESLAAFLAFSRGLLEEDRGDYEAAAIFYTVAAQQDPSYGDVQERLEGAQGIPMGPEELAGLMVMPEVSLPGPMGLDPMVNTLVSSVLDVASHQPEVATIEAGAVSTIIDVVPSGPGLSPILEAVITIMITIPR